VVFLDVFFEEFIVVGDLYVRSNYRRGAGGYHCICERFEFESKSIGITFTIATNQRIEY
jgi:hypothetical protein